MDYNNQHRLDYQEWIMDMGDSDMCEGMGAMMEEMVEDSESECDGSELT